MKILGIDWGEKKIGLAIANGFLAEPYRVVHSEDEVIRVIREQGIEKVVVGISESVSARKSQEFGAKLEKELKIPVEFQDETLSTTDAQRLAVEAGIKRKKRKGLEDSYAAAIMLQSYLNNV